MRIQRIAVLCSLPALLVVTTSLQRSRPFKPVPRSAMLPPTRMSYGKLPLTFEPNVGQTDKQCDFVARGKGYILFLAATEAVLSVSRVSSPIADRLNPMMHGNAPKGKVTFGKMQASSSKPSVHSETLRFKLVGANDRS